MTGATQGEGRQLAGGAETAPRHGRPRDVGEALMIKKGSSFGDFENMRGTDFWIWIKKG